MPIVTDVASAAESADRPWIELSAGQDAEMWIGQHNADLQECIKTSSATGYGVCFKLRHGGQIFMHTTGDAILLDVTTEAAWVAPVITAATGIAEPRSQMWVLPDDRLVQLLLGLNSLIASTGIVVSHNFKAKRF